MDRPLFRPCIFSFGPSDWKYSIFCRPSRIFSIRARSIMITFISWLQLIMIMTSFLSLSWDWVANIEHVTWKIIIKYLLGHKLLWNGADHNRITKNGSIQCQCHTWTMTKFSKKSFYDDSKLLTGILGREPIGINDLWWPDDGTSSFEGPWLKKFEFSVLLIILHLI